jgi:hypothetical protein
MPKEARHHHYIPQCYLRGFLPKGKKAKLTVLDLKDRRSFLEHPQGICAVRDFNRLEADGISPDALESAWSSSETDWADALKNLHRDRILDDEIAYRAVLTLIALFVARNPYVRAQWSQAMDQLGKLILATTLAVIGDFESKDQVLTVDAKEIAAMNSLIVGGAMRQVYAPNLSFGLIDGKGNLIKGSDLLRS